MNRQNLLDKFHFQVPSTRKVRVIVDSDVKNEADDQYAIIHHLLTPMIELKGVVAANFEKRCENIPEQRGKSMQISHDELKKLFELADIDDIPLLKGQVKPCDKINEISEGVKFIIQEARKEDNRPLYIACQGCLTDIAAAYEIAPDIAGKIVVIWIGGGPYPEGGEEFNLSQDIQAVRTVMESPIEFWQIPLNVYQTVEVSLTELQESVMNCGEIGKYLFDQLVETNDFVCGLEQMIGWPQGETWCLGDQPTVGVLLQSAKRKCYHYQKAPSILDDMSYQLNSSGKEIRVYDSIDSRLLLEDFFGKMRVCFGTDKI